MLVWCVPQIPWPTGPEGNMFALPPAAAVTAVDRKKLLRKLQLRWHPDKIQQKWSRKFVLIVARCMVVGWLVGW